MPNSAALGFDTPTIKRFGYRSESIGTVRLNCPQNRRQPLRKAVGTDFKGNLSLALYIVALPLPFFVPWAAQVIFVIVALIWLVPDRRIERVLPGK